MRNWLTKLFGDKGEREAARYLIAKGYKILARQYRNRQGELDLIALDGDCVVFVEVKTRSSVASGHPAESVTPAKQSQLTRLALVFLKQHRLLEHRARFDVVAITWSTQSREPVIEHYCHAFPATGFGQMFS